MNAGYEKAFVYAIDRARDARDLGMPKLDAVAVVFSALEFAFTGPNLDTAKCAAIAAYHEPLIDPVVLPRHSSFNREKSSKPAADIHYAAAYKGSTAAWIAKQESKYRLFCMMMTEEIQETGELAYYSIKFLDVHPWTYWAFKVDGDQITVLRGRKVAA